MLALPMVPVVPASHAAVVEPLFVYTPANRAELPRYVTALAQDGQGLMWMGTINTLYNYDGVRYTVVPWPGVGQLEVYALHVQQDEQRLWVGSARGLMALDLHTDRWLTVPAPPPSATHTTGSLRITNIKPAGDGTLWVMSGIGRLYRFDTRHMAWGEPLLDPAQSATSPLYGNGTLASDGHGGVWAPLDLAVVHVQANGRIGPPLRTAPERLAAASAERLQHTPQTIELDGQGRLWIGTRRGLTIWEQPDSDARQTLTSAPQACAAGSVEALMRDRNGTMWMSSARRLCRWRPGQPHGEAVPLNRLEHVLGATELVTRLFEDKAGVLWIGLVGPGPARADPSQLTAIRHSHLPAEAVLPSYEGYVMALHPLGGARVLVGTYAGEVRLHDLDSGESRTLNAELVGKQLKSALQTAPDHFWLGSESDGLFHFDPQTGRLWPHHEPPWSLRSRVINVLARDRQGLLWVGTPSGVNRMGGDGRWLGFPAGSGHAELIGDEVVNALLGLPDGEMLVGGRMGLRVWQPDRQRFIKPDEQPPAVTFVALHRDGQGQIWAAGSNGLYQVQRDGERWQVEAWQPQHGPLPAALRQEVRNLHSDRQGHLWTFGQGGAVRVDPRGGRAQAVPSLYPNEDTGYNVTALLPDGRLAFGSFGVYAFDPVALKEAALPGPPVIVSRLSLQNQALLPATAAAGASAANGAIATLAALGVDGPLRHTRALKLPYGHDALGIEFSALQYSPSSQPRFAWRLSGIDRDWNIGQEGARTATYTNLPPGRHLLEYRAAMDDGAWSPTPGQLEIEVTPPFWLMPWFYVLMGLLAVTLPLLVYHLRVRALKAAQQKLEDQVAQRTHQVQQEKAEAERQREAAEDARVRVGTLSELGRDVMATLDVQQICQTLGDRLATLLPVRRLRVLHTEPRQPMTLAYEWELGRGVTVAPATVGSDTLAARCISRGQAVALLRATGAPPLTVDAPPWAQAAMGVPLDASAQALGALMVFTDQAQPYSPLQQDLLRTLAGHLAGALSNAEAYRELRLTQASLVEQEKMAALGSLVAGVSHELNTPLGNGVLLATTLQDQTTRLAARVAAGGLRRSELDTFIETMDRSCGLLLASLNSASSLVRSFKQVAVDQTADSRRRYDLRALCEEVAATLASQFKPQRHRLVVQAPDELAMDGYPGSLSQVLNNLLLNAIHHGFDGRSGGTVTLTATAADDERVRIEVADNGAGIAAEHLPRIFEPFFTTRLGRGGSGLGLHVSYNIVTSLLGGQISVHSTPGHGTRFELLLPRVAPTAAQPPVH